MKREVNWQPEAEEDLADLWLNAPDRGLITRAAFQLDQRLERDAEGESESRQQKNIRIIFEAPLGALFRMDHAPGQVLVLHVWKYGKRKRNS